MARGMHASCRTRSAGLIELGSKQQTRRSALHFKTPAVAGSAPPPPPPPAPPAPTPTPPPPTPPPSGDVAAELLGYVNNARASAGVPPLTLDARLTQAAQAHSDDQAQRRRMGHDGSDGSSFVDRAARAGYRIGWGGENVAAGQKTVRDVFNAWMNSSGHRWVPRAQRVLD